MGFDRLISGRGLTDGPAAASDESGEAADPLGEAADPSEESGEAASEESGEAADAAPVPSPPETCEVSPPLDVSPPDTDELSVMSSELSPPLLLLETPAPEPSYTPTLPASKEAWNQPSCFCCDVASAIITTVAAFHLPPHSLALQNTHCRAHNQPISPPNWQQ